MDLMGLVVYALATWRVCSLLVNERGPGDVFLRLRELTGLEHDEDGKITIIPRSFAAEVFSCVWCMSFWAAGAWSALDWLFPEISPRVAGIFALSAGGVFLERLMERFSR